MEIGDITEPTVSETITPVATDDFEDEEIPF